MPHVQPITAFLDLFMRSTVLDEQNAAFGVQHTLPPCVTYITPFGAPVQAECRRTALFRNTNRRALLRPRA